MLNLAKPLDDRDPSFHREFYGPDSGWSAASVLAEAARGAAKAGRLGPVEAIPVLLDVTESPHAGQRAAAAQALGPCAKGAGPDVVRRVVTRLLELTSDYPRVAGRAIDALGELAAEPDRVVPRLAELFDQFEEFDCDEGYAGEHARVRRALEGFGKRADGAATRLAEWIAATAGRPNEEFPTEAARTLEQITGAAPAVVRVLSRALETAQKRPSDLRDEWIAGLQRLIAQVQRS